MEKNNFGIYIHIPFCKKKCKYCDFISFSNMEFLFNSYIESVLREIDSYFDVNKNNKDLIDELGLLDISFRKVDTIYFGGGTPSFVDKEMIGKILNKIRERFNVLDNAEITIEVNPGTVDREKLEYYKSIGINRLSIGLQSTYNRLLELIGRIHTYEEFLITYGLAREIGFDNINIDLMLALPTQSLEEIKRSVSDVIELNPEHISLYSLILEDGTELKREIDSGELELVEEDIERKMYHETKALLEENGFIHYEISNFAKEGFESKHNLNCWNQGEYLGFGMGAHSYYNDIRFSKVIDINKYISFKNLRSIINIEEKQNEDSKAKEFMMLSFRKIKGVNISEFEQKFGVNPLFVFRFEIDNLVKKDLIEVDLDNIVLTEKGLDFANIVFEEFV